MALPRLQASDVVLWHFSDLTLTFGDVCSSGESGHRSRTRQDRFWREAVIRQRTHFFGSLVSVTRSVGHDVMIDAPTQLADILERLA